MGAIVATYKEHFCDECKIPFRVGEEVVFVQYAEIQPDVAPVGNLVYYDDDNTRYDYHFKCFTAVYKK